MPVPTGSSFDANFYLAAYKDVKTAAETAVKDGKAGSVADFAYDHWLAYGVREARNPNAVFSATAYLLNNKDVQQAFNRPGAASLNPLSHYDLYGWSEKDGTGTDTTHRRSAATGGLFNADYYTAANPAAFGSGSPAAYFMAALRAAASATSTTSLGFAASAYVPTVAYLNFDFVYYLQKNADVSKSVLGDKGTVPATNTALTLIQKGKALYHWFNYGQLEGRVAHRIGSASDDKTSDFVRITDPSVTAKATKIVAGTTSYTATALDDIFFYSSTTESIAAATTVTGWGGPDSAFIWDSGAAVENITVTGIANMVFSTFAGKTPITDTTTVKGYTKTANGTYSTDMSFADATVTKLAVIHTGNYTVSNLKTVTGFTNNYSMAFFNLGENIGDLYLQGLTSGTSDEGLDARYDLFGYKAAPVNNTVTVTVNGMKSSDDSGEDYTVINLSSKSAGDIKTIKVNAQGNSSSVTVMAADGDDSGGTALVEQRVTKLVITGDKGVSLNLKDGIGTNAFDTLDISGFKGDKVTYTATYGNHMATIIGGSSALSYKSGHTITSAGVNDLYGQTFQFGTADMGTNKAGTLAAVKTVGKIEISNIPGGSNIVDSFNLSTKIFGFTAAQWASIDESKTYLFANGNPTLSDSATAADSATADPAATGNDSYFYILGASSVNGMGDLSSYRASVDLTFGKIETGKGHAAIVVLKNASGIDPNKMDIYFTEDNTKFDASHVVLIGSYQQTGAWGTGAAKNLDSTDFHIIA